MASRQSARQLKEELASSSCRPWGDLELNKRGFSGIRGKGELAEGGCVEGRVEGHANSIFVTKYGQSYAAAHM
jgi:hypothetical protein